MTELSAITENPEVVAAIIPGDQLFGLLNRSVDLPPYWCALVAGSHGGRVWCPPGTAIQRGDAEQLIVLRTQPVILEFALTDLASADHFDCTADIGLQVQVNPEPDDVQAFRETIAGTQPRVTRQQLSDILRPGVLQATRRVVRQATAAALRDDVDRRALLESIREALQEVLFRGGLRIEAVCRATIDSSAYRQSEQQRRRLQRQQQQVRAEQQIQQAIAEARDAHLTQLEQTLTRLHDLAAATPQASLQELIQSFSPGHRAFLYGALWRTSDRPAPTAWVVVASGAELLFFDPRELQQPAHRQRLSTAAGPLRSLTCERSADGTTLLLVGAARGAVLVPANSEAPPATYLAEADRPPRGGFNAVALAGTHLYATHSELGLLRWDTTRGGAAEPLLPRRTAAAATVRQVQFAQDRIWLAVDQQVLSLTLDHDQPDAPPCRVYHGAGAAITALLATPSGPLAGTAGGTIHCWPVEQPEHAETLYRGQPRSIESVAQLSAHGVRRLFFSDTSTAVHAQVIGDAFSCRYQAGGQTIRRAEVAADWIVGTNELRDRLFLWPTALPHDPPRVVAVSHLTGHTIQDVTLIPDFT